MPLAPLQISIGIIDEHKVLKDWYGSWVLWKCPRQNSLIYLSPFASWKEIPVPFNHSVRKVTPHIWANCYTSDKTYYIDLVNTSG
jgi:hypothetical protein